MKKLTTTITGLALIFMFSCSPIITTPLLVTDNPIGSKTGEASYRLNIFGLPTTKVSNVGAAQAAKNGGITKIATIDKQINPQDKSFKIIVTGE
ncbi:MAG: TRL domain-containing protein [Flavobacteriales bacterium]|jgi:hypothetical protein|nr:TRL domain-containing protein [Flavobacteriales bacterium]MDG1797772.1 TRL domain-containing protein [Flavobacteriales bacterium]